MSIRHQQIYRNRGRKIKEGKYLNVDSSKITVSFQYNNYLNPAHFLFPISNSEVGVEIRNALLRATCACNMQN